MLATANHLNFKIFPFAFLGIVLSLMAGGPATSADDLSIPADVQESGTKVTLLDTHFQDKI